MTTHPILGPLLAFDSTTNALLGEIDASGQFEVAALSGRPLALAFAPPPEAGIGSMVLSYGNLQRTENVSPYALFGDINGNFAAGTLPEGAAVFEAVAYAGSNGTGAVLARLDFTLDLSATRAEAPPPDPSPDPLPELPDLDPPVIDPPVTDPPVTDHPDTNPPSPPNSDLIVANPLTDPTGLAARADQIVFHFDGNNNDPDDIAAVAVAAVLAKAAGIEGKTTFFYGNNLSEPNGRSTQLAAMENSGAFAESLGVTSHNYQDDIQATTLKLVDLLQGGDRVLLIEGGPMEAVYRALSLIDPALHANLTLLSHSSWNENRNRTTRDTDGVDDGVISARTWADLQADFPDATYIDIADQNAGNNNSSGFNNRAWEQLDSASDPVLAAARAAMLLADDVHGGAKRNDPSDAGMLFYALTGKERAVPQDAFDYIAASTVLDAPQPVDPVDPPDPIDPPDPVDPVDPPAPIGPLMQVALAFTDNGNTAIDDLQLQDTITLEELNERPVTLVARALPGAPSIGSVALDMSGVTSAIENVTPYVLFGDRGGVFRPGEALDAGTYEIILTIYSGRNATGDVLGTQVLSLTIPEDGSAPAPVNTPPQAQDDTLAILAGGSALVDVLANDSDADGDPLVLTGVTGPAVIEDGQLRITAPEITGDVTLSYTLSDGIDFATGTLTLSVMPPPADPVLIKAINIGGPGYTAQDGTVFEADTTAIGRSYSVGNVEIAGTEDDLLFRSEAWGPNKAQGLAYEFALGDGFYEVELFFADIYRGTSDAGTRVFDVALEGQTVLEDLDLSGSVGWRTARVERFLVEVSDGVLDLDLTHGIENPKLSALRIWQADDATDGDAFVFFDVEADGIISDYTSDPVSSDAPETDLAFTDTSLDVFALA